MKYRVVFCIGVLIFVIASSCYAATTFSNEGSNPKYGSNSLASLLSERGGVKALLDGRIVGGNETTINDVPWIVSLMYYGSFICGGSLITTKRVLTAAHCTDGSSASSLSIRAGSTFSNSGGHTRQISMIIQHSLYNSNTLENDLSILVFGEALDISLPTISTVALPESSYPPAVGALAFVSGWGVTCETCGVSTTLRYVYIPIISNQQCNNAYGSGSITDGMICAAYTNGGKDACQGDSGGPLTYNGKIEGITSWGYGCGRPNYPGVYTRVSYYLNWINNNL